jgi:hypothetical protein
LHISFVTIRLILLTGEAEEAGASLHDLECQLEPIVSSSHSHLRLVDP